MNHDAIAVQLCLSAGLSEGETDTLLTRLATRLDGSNGKTADVPADACQHKRYSIDRHEETGTCLDCRADGRMMFVVPARRRIEGES